MLAINKAATTLKELSQFIPNLNYLEAVRLLQVVADALHQGQTLADSLERLNVSIPGIAPNGGGLMPGYRDISDELELIDLVTQCTANLQQAYRYI